MSWITIQHLFILSRFLLVFYFLHAGIKNIFHFSQRVLFLQSKNFPLPKISMAIAIIFQIVGSVAVLFNYYAAIGAILLIIFTVLCNFVICNYWRREGLERQLTSTIFYANFAVIGGLIIIVAISL